jgi:hypothetical protein
MLLMACNIPADDDDDNGDDDDEDDEDEPPWPVSEAVSLLSTIQSQQAAQPAWEQWVAEHFTVELAGKLFLAAAARENAEAMTLINSIKPGAVPAAAVYAALAKAVQQEQTHIVLDLCEGAASVCDAASLVPLLLAALEQGYAGGWEALLGLAGQRLDAAQLLTLLHAAVEHGNSQFLSDLVQLPAATQLQWVECEALLETALGLWRKGCQAWCNRWL